MTEADAMEIPKFARKEVIHTYEAPDCGFLNTRLAKQKCELQFELNDRVRKKKLSKGLLRSHSISLQRKSPYCFFGYHFLDSLQADMPWLSKEQAKELAEYLFRLKYVVPVMKYVREMSTTTALYRYATDERIVAASLRQERIASSHIARVIMDRTPGILFIGEKLLELLETNAQNWSYDVEMPSDRQLTTLCQKLLLHGYLVPVQEEQAPERFQTFRRENSYYLCDSESGRDQVFHFMDYSSTITTEKNNSIFYLMSDNSTNTTVSKQTSIRSNSILIPQQNIRQGRQPERRNVLRRSISVRARKKSKAIVYWSMEVETKGQHPKKENKEIKIADFFQRQTSIIASDVEILHLSQPNNTYEPPIWKNSPLERVAVILKKFSCGVYGKIALD